MPTDSPRRPDPGDCPDEFFLDGPVPGGEELLRRTVARVRRHAIRSARLRRALLAVAMLLAAVTLATAGMVIGRWSDAVRVVGGPIGATAHGVRLTATMNQAEGGSYLDVLVTGLPVGTTCRLTVIGKDGTRVDGGGWGIGSNAAHWVDLSAWMPPADVSQLDVTTSVGIELVGWAK